MVDRTHLNAALNTDVSKGLCQNFGVPQHKGRPQTAILVVFGGKDAGS